MGTLFLVLGAWNLKEEKSCITECCNYNANYFECDLLNDFNFFPCLLYGNKRQNKIGGEINWDINVRRKLMLELILSPLVMRQKLMIRKTNHVEKHTGASFCCISSL